MKAVEGPPSVKLQIVKFQTPKKLQIPISKFKNPPNTQHPTPNTFFARAKKRLHLVGLKTGRLLGQCVKSYSVYRSAVCSRSCFCHTSDFVRNVVYLKVNKILKPDCAKTVTKLWNIPTVGF